MKNIIDWALEYAQLGWHIFPVKFKIPLTPNGFKDATIDPKIITDWFTKYPEAGIAVATGQISDIVVLDVDFPKHPEILAFLEKETKEKNIPTSKMQTITGGGGSHIIYKYPKGKDVGCCAAWNGHEGIDIRGNGGYAVLPPSPHESGNIYKWDTCYDEGLENISVPVFPDYFLVTRPHGKKIIINLAINEGRRHLELAKRAGMLRAAGLEPEQIFKSLSDINVKFCRPPLEENEIQLIAFSMKNYPAYNTKVAEKKGEEENGNGVVDLEALIGFELNDTGHAEALNYLHGKRLKHNCSIGKWLIWNGQTWSLDSTGYVKWFVIDTYRKIKEAAQTVEDDDKREKILKSASGVGNYNKLSATLKIAESVEGIATETQDWDANPMLFGVQNGIIDLKTGQLEKGKPEQLISKTASIAFDPDATCPRWLLFLNEIFDSKKDIINFVQRMIGYLLTGHIAEQYMYMLVGHGANGKSTLLNVILKMMGNYGIKTPFSTFERKFGGTSNSNDIASLDGKRFIMASESNDGVGLDEAKLKALTGGDVVAARYLYQENFNFNPVGKIVLAINHRPVIRDDSYGFWRRVLLIDFPVVFDEARADKYLINKLLEELPGILNWAIQGCLLWQKDGLLVPDRVRAATEQYRTDSNPLQEMFSTYFVVDLDNASLSISNNDAYRLYQIYATKMNLKPVDRMSRSKYLNKLDNSYIHTSAPNCKIYHGLALNDQGKKLLEETEQVTVTISNMK